MTSSIRIGQWLAIVLLRSVCRGRTAHKRSTTASSPFRTCTLCRLSRCRRKHLPRTARRTLPDEFSRPVAVGLHLLVDQADELFEQVEVLGAGDGMDLLDQLAAALDPLDKALDAERGQWAAGALERQEFVDFVGGKLAGAVGVAFHPADEFWLRRLVVEPPDAVVAVGRVAVAHARQQAVQRRGPQFADR